MGELAPICLFTYTRIEETIQTINALKCNYLANQSDLIIFSDGPKNNRAKKQIIDLRNYLKSITGFKSITIYESKVNKGLANSIIDGVTKVFNDFEKIIVLEDDLVTTPNFLDFMNQALDYYAENKVIQSVNGYSLKIKNNKDIYFHERTFPWGWATWKNRWSKDIFDEKIINQKIKADKSLLSNFNKKCGNDMSKMLLDSLSGVINSWYARWSFNHFVKSTYAVYPNTSKIINIGFDNQGTHCIGINTYVSNLDKQFKRNFSFVELFVLDKKTNNEFLYYFKRLYKLNFRLKLMCSVKGRSLLKKEIKNRVLKS